MSWKKEAVLDAINPTCVCRRYTVDEYIGGGTGIFECFWRKSAAIRYAKKTGADTVTDAFTDTRVWTSPDLAERRRNQT
jgi:hypothetical protein